MFEDSVFASGRQVRAGRRRWAVAGAAGLQGLVLAALWVAPLFRPEGLPVVLAMPKVALVRLKKVEVRAEAKPRELRVMPGLATFQPVARPAVLLRGAGGGRLGRTAAAGEGGPGELAVGVGMGSGTGLPAGMGIGGGGGPVVTVARAAAPGKQRVSSGVSAGLLLEPIRPEYPAIAKAAGVQGTVVVTATIDRVGRITGLQVLSGPAMLRPAAVEAVRAARYRPYPLNGEATEVETTISVNFRMGG